MKIKYVLLFLSMMAVFTVHSFGFGDEDESPILEFGCYHDGEHFDTINFNSESICQQIHDANIEELDGDKDTPEDCPIHVEYSGHAN